MKALVLAVAAAGALALTGCSREKPITDDEANAVVDDGNMANAMDNAAAAPANAAANIVKPAGPPPVFTQDQQMHDDADATGMTSRTEEGDAGTATTGNEAGAEAK